MAEAARSLRVVVILIGGFVRKGLGSEKGGFTRRGIPRLRGGISLGCRRCWGGC